jgi:hypothetical protein
MILYVSPSVQLLAYFFPVVFAIPLFGAYLAREWLWYFTPSLSYVGQGKRLPELLIQITLYKGIIMGFPTTASMNLVSEFWLQTSGIFLNLNQGMFVGWAILVPLSKNNGWTSGSAGDMTYGGRGWILWIALAILTADSLISIIPVATEFVFNIISIFKSNRTIGRGLKLTRDGEVEPPSRLVPGSWVLSGLGASVIGGTAIIWFVFGYEGIKPWATVLGFMLGGGMSLLG